MAQIEGWAWPVASRKVHYFRNGRSLCCKWGFGGMVQSNQGNERCPDDCAECWKKRDRELAKARPAPAPNDARET